MGCACEGVCACVRVSLPRVEWKERAAALGWGRTRVVGAVHHTGRGHTHTHPELVANGTTASCTDTTDTAHLSLLRVTTQTPAAPHKKLELERRCNYAHPPLDATPGGTRRTHNARDPPAPAPAQASPPKNSRHPLSLWPLSLSLDPPPAHPRLPSPSTRP